MISLVASRLDVLRSCTKGILNDRLPHEAVQDQRDSSTVGESQMISEEKETYLSIEISTLLDNGAVCRQCLSCSRCLKRVPTSDFIAVR